ncbi:hypothetical protein Ferp_0661 [Ferroglobus placidus DSM 10642]|uniref:CARDB domain-containing protein n=1 Tax=Ferroglobus placidus (strain DSM 10642 / AEDII12DO) TaxID=589924 RepID=D3S3J9_FERPA|nr:hypothetical protein [Ferroglobus placidus]ADC64832.1 hypothetical protein Ferp_0661 [Ferroglobus placidus DSM 10642]
MNVRILLSILIACFLSFPASAISEVNVKFVSYVKDFGLYVEEKPLYGKNDEVKVYVDAKGVNHFRAYSVDFAFVIYDPEGYPVLGALEHKEGTGWEDEVYAVYTFKIPENWINGKYKLDVYVFDVLNTTATYQEYKSFVDRLIEKGEASISVKEKSRKDVDYVKKTVYFTVVDYVPPKVYLFDSHLKAKELPPGMNNSLIFTAFNSGEKPAKFYVWLYIDGKKVSKKKVEIGAKKYLRVEFEIPQLEVGKHRIEVVPEWNNVVYAKGLPIYVPPIVFDKPVLISEIGKGFIVLSKNNYVLGSGGVSNEKQGNPSFPTGEYDMNRDNAAKMITNILAYTWQKVNGKGDIDVALYIKSDDRAEKVLPELLEYISKISGAPIKYKGVVSKDELEDVDVLFYVSPHPDLSDLEEFVKKGGILIVDVSTYWLQISYPYDFREVEDLYRSFFDFSSLNKTVFIKLVTELKLPPELKYENLTLSDFLVNVGEEVKISFDVKNVGGPGKVPISVFVNDEEVYNETVEFFPNEQKHIELTYVPQKEGAYKVTVDGISKVFFAKEIKKENVTAKEKATPKPEMKRRENAALVVALVGILAVLIAIRLYLRK